MTNTILQPVAYGQSKISLRSDITDAMTFDVRGYDYFVPQLIQSAAWPSGFVLTLRGAIGTRDTFSDFATAIEYTTEGIKKAVSVVGVDYVRLYTSTTGGAITVEVRANGVKDV